MTELAPSLGCVYELCVDYDSHDDGTPYYAWWIRLPASEHARLGKDGLPLAIGPLRQYLTTQPKPDPEAPGGFLPNGAASKAALNRSINDAGWGVFLTILHAKAESAGREVIVVDPRNTSRTCPECGHVSAENRPTQDTFRCVSCGHHAHADTVGALNVLRAGPVRREAQPA